MLHLIEEAATLRPTTLGGKCMDDSYLVIARRYRPQQFADVIGQDAIVRTLKNALQSGRVCHAYLFAGSRGTGKTSIARLYAKALNCSSLLASGEPCNTCPSCVEITEGRSLDVQEIDGASHRGIDHIRALTESASYAPSCGRYKIYLIDEVHMLTKEAFNALLKTLEEPPPSVKFFLATTEPHKIPTTIISRCQRFNLRRLSQEAIVSKLQRIVTDMNVRAEEAALHRLAGYADGGLRDAESLLDQVISFSEGHIREEIVEEVFGIAPIDWLLELDRAIATADISVAYTISDRVFHEGKDIGHFIDDVTDHFRSLLLLKLRIPSPSLAIGTEAHKAMCASAALMSQEHLLELLNILAEAQRTLKTAASQRFLLEWLLLNIVRIQRKVPLPLIARKLFELQEQIKTQSAATPTPHADKEQDLTPQPCLAPPARQKASSSTDDRQHGDGTQKPASQQGKEAPQAAVIVSLPVAEAAAVLTPQPSSRNKATSRKSPSPKTADAIHPASALRKEEGGTTANALAAEVQVSAQSHSLPPPVTSMPEEQEKARQENLIQFTAVELGASIIRPSTPS